MRATLTPPPPHRSEDKLAKLDPSKGVITPVKPEHREIKKEFTFPDPSPSNEAWGAQRRDSNGANQYEKIRAAWSTPESDPRETVNMWAKAMHWQTLNPSAATLVGTQPSVLLNEPDDLYVGAPCLITV